MQAVSSQRVGEAKHSGEPGWQWRRIFIFPNVAISFWFLYILIGAQDSRVNDTIAWGLILNIISSVAFYTGFATAQDIAAIMATRTGLPYASPPVAVDGEPVEDPPQRDTKE